MANCPHLSLWHSETEWDRYFNVRVNSINDASISCKNFVKFSTVTPELAELICELLVRHGKNLAYSVKISQDILDQFSQPFSPYESALGADDQK